MNLRPPQRRAAALPEIRRMILADTSIWIDHLRKADADFAEQLNQGQVVMHPAIMGEILLGSLSNRTSLETALSEMPQALQASDKEVMFFINTAKVYGRGIGWVDTHLLVSARLTGARLVTRDKRLAAVAKELGLG